MDRPRRALAVRDGQRAVRDRGPSSLYEIWFHDVVVVAAAVLILVRAAYEPTIRRFWLALGLAAASWGVGTIVWSLVYGGQAHPPYPTFADILWLAWYPLMVWGIIELVKVRIPGFELHRWMDGLAVTLVVLAAGFALVIQPLAGQTPAGPSPPSSTSATRCST